MGTYYSIFDNDEIYCDEFNTLRIDRPEPRHPFDIPVPEDNTFFYKDYFHIDYRDYGYEILSSYP